MNVRLQYDTDFLGGVYYDERLQLNNYSASISMVTKTIDPVETNIAMDRLKFFINEMLAGTVFINQAHMEQAETLSWCGANVTTLPEEPVDQIVGMMLYYKLNAIMEGRIEITQLDISSTLGEGVWYLHDEEDNAGPFSAKGWWNDSSTQHDSIEVEPVTDNVVKVVSTGWYEAELDWPEQPSSKGNTVVFGKFPKDEN
jgi:hypothetical protein